MHFPDGVAGSIPMVIAVAEYSRMPGLPSRRLAVRPEGGCLSGPKARDWVSLIRTPVYVWASRSPEAKVCTLSWRLSKFRGFWVFAVSNQGGKRRVSVIEQLRRDRQRPSHLWRDSSPGRPSPSRSAWFVMISVSYGTKNLSVSMDHVCAARQ